MLNFKMGGGTIRKIFRSLLTTDKTVSVAGQFAADAKSIKDLNDSFQWRLHATLTNTTQINLPSSFNELLICFQAKATFDNSVKKYCINIPYIDLDTSPQNFLSGTYANATNYAYCQCAVSKTVVKYVDFTSKANNDVVFQNMKVYYR